MKNQDKIEALKNIILNSVPQKTDYLSHSGAYSANLLAIRHITLNGEQFRDITLRGSINDSTIDMELSSKGHSLFFLSDMSLIERLGNRTPIYKIIRDSILFSFATLDLPQFSKALKVIDTECYPFISKECITDIPIQITKEIKFVKKLASAINDCKCQTKTETQIIYPKSTRLRQAISWQEKDKKKLMAIHSSLKTLTPFAPQKDLAPNFIPDIYVGVYDDEYIDQVNTQHIVMLNTGREGAKEKFWWDYFKTNVFLDEPEYKRSFFLLLNNWKVSELLRWIEEYRTNGWYESPSAQNRTLFILKGTEKSSLKIVTVWGQTVKVSLNWLTK